MPNGLIFGLFMIILFTLRFIDEFFKIDQAEFEEGMLLNMGQILSIPYVLAGIGVLIFAFRNKTAPREITERG